MEEKNSVNQSQKREREKSEQERDKKNIFDDKLSPAPRMQRKTQKC